MHMGKTKNAMETKAENDMKTKAELARVMEMVRGQQVIRKARRATSRSEARKQGYRG